MAIQVVTPENFTQLVTTGKVDEFKPPEAAKPAAEAKPPAGETPAPNQPARGPDGKFTKPEGSDKTTAASSTSPGLGAVEDDDEKDLSETVRRKIDRKHRQAKEAEEFASRAYRKQLEAEQRAEQLQRELEATKTKSGPSPSEAPKEPKKEDFTTVGEYTDALVAYRVEQRFAKEKADQEAQREAAAKADRERQFGERVAAAKAKHADFDEVLQSIAGTDLDRIHGDVNDYIQESAIGPEILYHLMKNPDVTRRLQKLSSRAALVELGKIESKLEAQEQPAPKESTETKLTDLADPTKAAAVSRAPAPIAALSSDKSTVVRKDPKDMSFQELRAYERQREAERRAARH